MIRKISESTSLITKPSAEIPTLGARGSSPFVPPHVGTGELELSASGTDEAPLAPKLNFECTKILFICSTFG